MTVLRMVILNRKAIASVKEIITSNLEAGDMSPLEIGTQERTNLKYGVMTNVYLLRHSRFTVDNLRPITSEVAYSPIKIRRLF